jgi:hypothetical protein
MAKSTLWAFHGEMADSNAGRDDVKGGGGHIL